MKNKTWLFIAIAVLVVVIILIARQSGAPTEVPITTTTTEAVVDEVLPLEPEPVDEVILPDEIIE